MRSMKKYLFSMMKETKVCSKLRYEDDRRQQHRLQKQEIRVRILEFLKQHADSKNDINNVTLVDMADGVNISAGSLFNHIKALENENILKAKKNGRNRAQTFTLLKNKESLNVVC